MIIQIRVRDENVESETPAENRSFFRVLREKRVVRVHTATGLRG